MNIYAVVKNLLFGVPGMYLVVSLCVCTCVYEG